MTITAPAPVATVQCPRCRQQRDPSEFGAYHGHQVKFCAPCRERVRARNRAAPPGLVLDAVADAHAPQSVLGRAATPRVFYVPPDPIELACPACTLRWTRNGWTHDPGSVLRSAKL